MLRLINKSHTISLILFKTKKTAPYFQLEVSKDILNTSRTFKIPLDWSLAPLDVGGQINLIRELRYINLKSILDLIQNLGVGLVGNEGDGEALDMLSIKKVVLLLSTCYS